MGKRIAEAGPAFRSPRHPAIRFLVDSALRQLGSAGGGRPNSREDWVERLTEALMSDSETSHKSVIASIIANGYGSRQLCEFFVPAASRRLGELWVQDRASFVEVTVGAGRLQALFRDQCDGTLGRIDRTIPLGQTMLMIVPAFEDHSLGAFVAADQLRRHGVWVHLCVGLNREETAEQIFAQRFSVLGISVATAKTLEKATDLIDYLRSKLDDVPPIVIGGRAVTEGPKVAERTGADFAVRTAREAAERCGLSTIGTALNIEHPA